MHHKHHPDKRTKVQVLRLLDNALQQEEKLVEKIQALENQLSECQKRAENPRYEITESALPNSKISFRIDFYRTEKRGPVKGIIENLSTRESRSFGVHEDGMDVLQVFINKHLPIKARPKNKPEAPATAFPKPTMPLSEWSAPAPPSSTPAECVLQSDSPVSSQPLSPEMPVLEEAIVDTPPARRTLEPLPAERLADRIRRRLEMAEPVQEEEPVEASVVNPSPSSAPTRHMVRWSGGLRIVTADEATHQRTLRSNQAFQVEILGLEGADLQGERCEMRLSGENLETGEVTHLGTLMSTASAAPARLPQTGCHLSPGGYRLTVVGRLPQSPAQVFFRESRLLVVDEAE